MAKQEEGLLQYKLDYSVQLLNTEKERLGRSIRENEDSYPEEYIENIRKAIKKISETLDLLKLKYKINEGK